MNKSTTIYQQLMDSVKKKIIEGELKIGDRLDSERVMSEKYGINRMTVRNAIKHLEEEGIVESVRGSGSYVKSMPLIEGVLDLGYHNSILSLSRQIKQKGMRSSRILLSMQKMNPIGDVAVAFPDEENVYEIIRLSFINDNPYAVQKTYIPCSDFSDAQRYDFENESLYDYMQDKDKRPKRMVSYLRIESLPAEYISIMKVRENKKFFVFDYYGYDKQDKLVEYTISYHHSNYTTFRNVAKINL